MTHSVTKTNASVVRPAVNAMLAADAAMLDGFEKIVTFNMQVGKAALQEGTQVCLACLMSTNGSGRPVPTPFPTDNMEKFTAYCRHVQTVGNDVQTALAQVMHTYVTETDQQVRSLVGGFSQQAAALGLQPNPGNPFEAWLKALSKVGEGMAANTEAVLKSMGEAAAEPLKVMSARALV